MLLAILLAAAAAPPAATSPLFADEGLSAALGRIDPRAGAWAEYLIRPKGKGNGNLRLRATALPASGEGRYWLELATASEAGLVSAVRMLLRGTEFSLGSVERMFLLLAGQPPIEIPPEQIARATGRSGAAAKADRLGTERVRVPAGEFTADAIRAGKTRIWRSAAVPLWGLIKALSPRQSMELVASGTSGGRSVFPAGWDQGNGSDSMK